MHSPGSQAPVDRDEAEGQGAIPGTSRMEAFADGVFAIAFTLPIFNVALPALNGSGAGFGNRLLAGWPENHVDARLDPAYPAWLTRRYRRMTAWNVSAALVVWLWWPLGVAMSWTGVLSILQAPETPRDLTEAPTIEGEG